MIFSLKIAEIAFVSFYEIVEFLLIFLFVFFLRMARDLNSKSSCFMRGGSRNSFFFHASSGDRAVNESKQSRLEN